MTRGVVNWRTMGVWVVVVAAGGGTRFGAPKQFAPLGTSTVLERSVATAVSVADGVVVVLPTDRVADAPGGVCVTAGGATRSASVRAGLALVPDDVEVVIVHDAARPFATDALYAAVIAAVRAGADAAVPALPIADTVKRIDGVEVVATVPRDDLVVVQTPQAFAAAALRAAHAGGGEGTDDAAMIEAAGGRVVVVAGEHRNFKITVPADLAVAAALLEAT